MRARETGRRTTVWKEMNGEDRAGCNHRRLTGKSDGDVLAASGKMSEGC